MWIAKWHRDQEKCPRCGNPRSACKDPDRLWYPQRSICYASREQAAAQRRWELLHTDRPFHDGTYRDWAEKPSRSHPYHRDDGVTIWAATEDIAPDDDFLQTKGGDL